MFYSGCPIVRGRIFASTFHGGTSLDPSTFTHKVPCGQPAIKQISLYACKFARFRDVVYGNRIGLFLESRIRRLPGNTNVRVAIHSKRRCSVKQRGCTIYRQPCFGTKRIFSVLRVKRTFKDDISRHSGYVSMCTIVCTIRRGGTERRYKQR